MFFAVLEHAGFPAFCAFGTALLETHFFMAWNSAHTKRIFAPPGTTRAMLSYARCSEQRKNAFQNSEECCLENMGLCAIVPLCIYAYICYMAFLITINEVKKKG